MTIDYIIRMSPPKAAVKAGMETIAPYFTKDAKENFTPWSWSWLVHMMPANAPVGVKKAPRFEPITDAKRAATVSSP